MPSPTDTSRTPSTSTALLALAGPVYVELLSGVVAGIVDTFWVARLGRTAIGAVAVATTVENVLLGVVLAIGVGTTVLLAAERGALRATARAAWLLWLAVTPLVALGGWAVREPLAAVLTGGEGAQSGAAAAFLAVSMPGVAVYFAQNVVDGIFKGLGDTRTPMRMALLANATLLVLDPVLIYGLCGAPRLGVTGAALALVASRVAPLLVSLRRARRLLHRAEPATRLRPAEAARRILRVGLPTSADFVARMLIGLAMVALTARFGAVPLAAYGIGTKVMLVATMAFYAVRQAASIRLGRTPEALASIRRQALQLAWAAALVADAVLLAAPEPLLRVFTGDAAVLHAGVVLFRYLAGYLLALAGVVALAGALLATGRAAVMLRITVLGAAAQIPLAWALDRVMGVQGVWLAMPLGTALQLALTFGALFLPGGKRGIVAAPPPSALGAAATEGLGTSSR
ncbi:MATE family efflux transporter [Streptacidiphilus melanogenes]|uniref:MATE family efflux transporter n=1 Tax=Streptacidiphilus melanogenes TaxID=411235 RepID=UPI0007C80F33|nr:MATE family efflux transporter [Streptacidiphilus melanogenes]